ncbi:Hypp5004 [Branchiostoma lanceolatum]|uniref:Hypp5004 protein n=1 Tax=Branchiostoma lanceolatum TaxID=7740 RepID=A0A8K0EXU5_BRALA|nr:Hypp5004 [Branchiostoma lanceolatum]
MQTAYAVKGLPQSGVLAAMWGVVKTQTSPDETAEGSRRKSDLPPVHEPLRRRNALGDIFLGIDTERVERFRLDRQGAPAGKATPLDTPAEPQDVPCELSRKRRVSGLYTTLETIYEEEDTEDGESEEISPDQTPGSEQQPDREVNNNAKRRAGLGDIFEGVDEASVESLRRLFSPEADETNRRRSRDEHEEAQLVDENTKPALKRRKAQANIFEGLDTATIENLRLQYKGKASSSPIQDTAKTTSPLRQHHHALWSVLAVLGVSVQGVRRENSPKIDTDNKETSAHLPAQQTDETQAATANRKPVLRRRDASLNLLEGLDAATLRGEGDSSADNSAPAAAVSDYGTFSSSPRATRRRNALTDITDLQKLYQTTCKTTGAWLSGMFVC